MTSISRSITSISFFDSKSPSTKITIQVILVQATLIPRILRATTSRQATIIEILPIQATMIETLLIYILSIQVSWIKVSVIQSHQL